MNFVIDANLLANAFNSEDGFQIALFSNADDEDLSTVYESLNGSTDKVSFTLLNSNGTVDVQSVTAAMDANSNIVLSVQGAVIPEPTTATLSLLALAALAARRRRK